MSRKTVHVRIDVYNSRCLFQVPLFLLVLEITFIVVGDAVHPGKCQHNKY